MPTMTMFIPVNPGGQRQVNPFTWSSQVPLCSHGLLKHSLTSVSQLAPVKETEYLKKKLDANCHKKN